MIALIILIALSVLGILIKLFPENPQKITRNPGKSKKIYYSRDYQGRFIKASKSKHITYVGGVHQYKVNL